VYLLKHPLEVLEHRDELIHIKGVERRQLYRRQGLKQVLDLLASEKEPSLRVFPSLRGVSGLLEKERDHLLRVGCKVRLHEMELLS